MTLSFIRLLFVAAYAEQLVRTWDMYEGVPYECDARGAWLFACAEWTLDHGGWNNL